MKDKLPAKSKRQTFKQFDYNSSSPFLDKMMQKAKLNRKRAVIGTKPVDYIEKQTGEVKKGRWLFSAEEELVDSTTFMKLYVKNLDAFFEFSKTAQKVLKYFFVSIKRGRDYVDFNMKQCMEVSGYDSRTTIYKGITELLNKDIIAKGSNDTKFYINPAVIFNGSRMTIIKQYIKENSGDENEYKLRGVPVQRELKNQDIANMPEMEYDDEMEAQEPESEYGKNDDEESSSDNNIENQ